MNGFKRFLLPLAFVLGLLLARLIFASLAYAADLTISCTDTVCEMTPPGVPLFNETNMAPSDTMLKTITAKNLSSQTLSFGVEIQASSYSDSTPSLAQMLRITISEVGGGLLYGPMSLEDWKNDGYLFLSTILPSAEKEFAFAVALGNVGNDYQNKVIKFNLTLGAEAFPQPVSQSGSATSAGTAPTCGAQVPSSAPALSASATSDNTVLLTWTPVTPVTHYMIRFGYTPGNYMFGAPNVGDTTIYTVTDLSGDTAYYFQVAGVNDCAPGPWSNETTATPRGAVLGLGLPSGFEQILGASTDLDQVREEEPTWNIGQPGQVLAEEDCATPLPWWLPLLIQGILTLLIAIPVRDREKANRAPWIILTLGLLSQLAYIFIGCPCAEAVLCPWYGFLNILIILLGLLVRWLVSYKAKHSYG